MPIAVHRQEYFEEVIKGLRDTDARVFHIVLDASEATLRSRIDQDAMEPPHAKDWWAAKISQFSDARRWLLAAADLTIRTDDLPIDRVAAEIARLLAA